METLDNLSLKVDESLEGAYKEYQENFDKLVAKRDITTMKLRNLRSLLPRIIEGLAIEHLQISSLSYYVGIDATGKGDPHLKVSISAVFDGKFKFIKDQGYTSRGSGKNQKTLDDKGKKIEEGFLAMTQIKIRVNSMTLEAKKDGSERSVLIETYL